MANNSAVTDIGLVSPEWLQDSFDSPELDALLSQVELLLLLDEPCIAPPTTPPTSCKDESWAPSATVTAEELRQLQSKNTNKNTVNSTKSGRIDLKRGRKFEESLFLQTQTHVNLMLYYSSFMLNLERKTAWKMSPTAYALC